MLKNKKALQNRIKVDHESMKDRLVTSSNAKFPSKIKRPDSKVINLRSFDVQSVCKETLKRIHENLAYGITKTIHSTLLSTEDELNAVAQCPDVSILDRTVAKIALEGLEKGKITRWVVPGFLGVKDIKYF